LITFIFSSSLNIFAIIDAFLLTLAIRIFAIELITTPADYWWLFFIIIHFRHFLAFDIITPHYILPLILSFRFLSFDWFSLFSYWSFSLQYYTSLAFHITFLITSSSLLSFSLHTFIFITIDYFSHYYYWYYYWYMIIIAIIYFHIIDFVILFLLLINICLILSLHIDVIIFIFWFIIEIDVLLILILTWLRHTVFHIDIDYFSLLLRLLLYLLFIFITYMIRLIIIQYFQYFHFHYSSHYY